MGNTQRKNFSDFEPYFLLARDVLDYALFLLGSQNNEEQGQMQLY